MYNLKQNPSFLGKLQAVPELQTQTFQITNSRKKLPSFHTPLHPTTPRSLSTDSREPAEKRLAMRENLGKEIQKR